MIADLTNLGYGLITFAILIGVGLVVLTNFATSVGVGSANTSITTLMGYLGTGTGGLVTWVPTIIALFIGIMFLAAFGFGSKKR